MQQTNPDPFIQSLYSWANSEIVTNPDNEDNIRQALDEITLVRNNPQETTLHLARLRLTLLPDCIGQLTHLMSLNVCRNNLASIPDSIGNLPNLRSFNIGNNQLQTIPDSITDLPNLQYLFLNNNGLTILPNLDGLPLLTLDIRHNEDLNVEFLTPNTLERFETDGTPMSNSGFYTVNGVRILGSHDEYLRRETITRSNAPPPLSTPLPPISQIHSDSGLPDSLAPEMVEYFSDSNSLINQAFARFLTTTAYRSSENKPALNQDLLQIYTNIYHKREDADFCQIVSAFCEESLADCQDRNALFIFQLANLSQQKSQQEIQALSPSDQYDYFKSQFLFNHFYELGEKRVKTIKLVGSETSPPNPRFSEDVEVLLNYLRIFNNEFGGEDKLNLKFPRIVTQAYFEMRQYQPSPEEIEEFGTDSQDPDKLNEIIARQMALKLADAFINCLFSKEELEQIQDSKDKIIEDGYTKLDKLSESDPQYAENSKQIKDDINKQQIQILTQVIKEKLNEIRRVAENSQTSPSPDQDLTMPAQPSPAPAQTLPAPAQPLPRAPSADADGQVVNQDPGQRLDRGPSTRPTGCFAGAASCFRFLR